MSDLGDTWSDGEYDDFDPWYYIEETYHVADDLAEHTVASPPPYEDENYEDWDRFDYWNDIESGSEGYDDERHDEKKSLSKTPKTGQKRKITSDVSCGRKKRKIEGGVSRVAEDRQLSPTPTVLWRSRESRDKEDKARVKPFNGNEKPYALLRDWRERLGGTPRPTSRESLEPEGVPVPEVHKSGEAKSGPKIGPLSPSPEASGDELEGLTSASDIDSEALKSALQKRLAEAGGPFEGFDQSLLLKYAMRMIANEEASDEIAGELAEDMLNRPDDDPLAAGISSWLSQQMGTPQKTQEDGLELEKTKEVASSSSQSPFVVPMSPMVATIDQHPPTPSSTETNTSANASKKRMKQPVASAGPSKRKVTSQPSKRKPETKAMVTPESQPVTQPRTRKRKAETDEAESSESAPKPKRAARSYDAPTATSKAKAVPPALAKTTRSGRVRRG
ncbi:hypothetical protein AOQ84DRAFT_377063 [Glonium stellatum]|uniref:Uncharacterized protein n=1 Tax=Glonium stellatum TaxID=574774 RepID=A0A8E2JSP7_9PEZI|nr:hypothetical protein AOQ84DRAFT_377063 [Glonium stellatum]